MNYPPLQCGILCLAVLATTGRSLSAADERRSPPIETHSKTQRLPSDRLGPFVRLSDGRLLTVDQDAAVISSDGAKT